jgi:hypothetical protein
MTESEAVGAGFGSDVGALIAFGVAEGEGRVPVVVILYVSSQSSPRSSELPRSDLPR